MLTIKWLLELVQLGDWFITIDLKDAYYHVDLALKHRKFLCFVFQAVAYKYNRLPFSVLWLPAPSAGAWMWHLAFT